MQPREHAARLEARRHVAAGGGERFDGYGLAGMAFESGDVLAFHRCTASSVGPPFLSIWQRDAAGQWIFHTNIHARRSCPRYFGPAIAEARSDDIVIRWTGPASFVVTARKARLQLAVRLDGTPGGALLGMLGRALPLRAWASPPVSRVAAAAGAALLGSRTFALSGQAPSGHRFVLRPRRVWRVAGAACVLNGRECGTMTGVPDDVRLADFVPPAAPLLATGSAVFIAADGGVHAADVPARVAERDALIANVIRQARVTLAPAAADTE